MFRRTFAAPVGGKIALVLAALLWLLLSGAASSFAATVQEPADVVVKLQRTLLAVWRSDASFKKRYETLAPVVDASHDLANMARFALGTRWQELSKAQRELFLASFRRLTIANYADRFAQYSGERFVQSGQRELAMGQYLVQTDLIQSDGERVRLDYLLHQRDGQWKIINILADGVSELAIKRSEYTAFIRDHGFTALIKELQRKISAMAGENTPAPETRLGTTGEEVNRG